MFGLQTLLNQIRMAILELYAFDSNDAAGSPSMASDDNLAITTMTPGESIDWASLAWFD